MVTQMRIKTRLESNGEWSVHIAGEDRSYYFATQELADAFVVVLKQEEICAK